MERCPAARLEAEALLRALAGPGARGAEAARPAGRRPTESDAAPGDAAGAGQAAGRDSRVRAEVRRVQGACFFFALYNGIVWFFILQILRA